MINPRDIFFEIHCDLPREAPGDETSTRRAYAMMRGMPAQPHILDIACGPGTQTLHLAKCSDGIITAIDTHVPFLEVLRKRAEQTGLSDRITPLNQSMFALDFAEPFDVIWSEGAIYIIGFEEGLNAWRKWLKPGGYLAVTEVSWLRSDPPNEILTFWQSAYPGIQSVDGNLSRIERQGYTLAGHFTLPESAWWEPYYLPMQTRLKQLREKYAQEPDALSILDSEEQEIGLYRRYSSWYGYEFYVMQAR